MNKILVLVAGMLALGATSTKPTTNAPAEVKTFVKAYVDAWNRDDATDMMDMVSRKEGVSSISMGEITRGWDAIREDADEAAGPTNRPRMTLGVIDVQALGSGHALVVAPVVATLATDEGGIELRGAMTIVLEKTDGAWKVLHEHGSLQLVDLGEGD